MRTGMKSILVIGLVAVFAMTTFGQGMYWESATTIGGKEGKTMMGKSYYAPKMMKVTQGDEDFIIFRFDQQKLYTVKPDNKTYNVMTFAELESAGKRMSAEMAKLDEQMKNMPEEQRKMMEQMMGDRMPGKKKPHSYQVKKTGEKKMISGYACAKYVVTDNGKETMSLWVTPDVKGFAAMRADMMEQTRRMAEFNEAMGGGMVEAMAKIDGFPMAMDMSKQMSTVVTKLEQRSIPASEFEVPAGYKEVPSAMQQHRDEVER